MARQNVVITDGTTPLTFEPFTGQVGLDTPASWLEKSHGSFIGYGKLSLLTGRTKGAKGAFSTTLQLNKPKVVVVDGVDTVQHNAFFQGKFVLPDTMSLAERTAFAAYVANAISNSVVTDSVVKQVIAD